MALPIANDTMGQLRAYRRRREWSRGLTHIIQSGRGLKHLSAEG